MNDRAKDVSITNDLLKNLAECFTPEVARRVCEYRASNEIQRRLDYLREGANEGMLDEDEHVEYANFVDVLDTIALLKAHARKLLDW